MRKIGQDLNNISAVYSIYNTENGFEYIGSTSNLYKRMLKHRALLRHDKHPNWKLQNDWNELGEDKFDFKVIMKCSANKLKEKETFYIQNTRSCYNLASGAINYSFPEETRKRMSDGRKIGFAKGDIVCYQKKKVYKYDFDGNLVAEYDSIISAAKAEHINRTSINRCLNGTYTQMNGFRWSLTKQSNIGKYIKPKRIIPNKYTYIVNDGTSIMKFDGCKACAEYFGVSIGSIEQVIKNKNIYRKQYTIYKVCRSHE